MAARNSDVRPTERLGPLAVNWILGIVFVYATLLGVGYLMFSGAVTGLVLLAIAIGSAVLLWRLIGRERVADAAPDSL